MRGLELDLVANKNNISSQNTIILLLKYLSLMLGICRDSVYT